MPRRKSGEPDTNSFGPDMKWSPEARARRSEAAKKAAATRKANQAREAEVDKELAFLKAKSEFPYYQGSRLARILCRYVSPLALFVATYRVSQGEMLFKQRSFYPKRYVLTPSRKKRPFRFA